MSFMLRLGLTYVAEQLVMMDGVELCLETFGRPTDPALLLISGGASSMDWWDVEFCKRLADEGRFVIRYDHRDTGRSATSPVGKPTTPVTTWRPTRSASSMP